MCATDNSETHGVPHTTPAAGSSFVEIDGTGKSLVINRWLCCFVVDSETLEIIGPCRKVHEIKPTAMFDAILSVHELGDKLWNLDCSNND